MKKNVKKIFAMAMAALMAGAMMTGCGSSSGSDGADNTDTTAAAGSTDTEAASSEGGETASEKKVLKVGMECAYAPFNWTQTEPEAKNGDAAVPIFGTSDYAYGYDVMVAQQIADKLGWDLEIHKVDWSSIVLGMNAGDYDAIIAGMGYTAEREEAVDFTQPYYIRDNVMVVKADGSFANAATISDFTGASGTTQIGTIWEQYVPQVPDVRQLTYYETTSEVIMAVSTGAADFGVLDEPTAMSAAIANPGVKYIKFAEGEGFTVPEGQSLNVCIAVKEGDAELQEALDGALTEMGWNQDKMTELMNLAVELQPLSE